MPCLDDQERDDRPGSLGSNPLRFREQVHPRRGRALRRFHQARRVVCQSQRSRFVETRGEGIRCQGWGSYGDTTQLMTTVGFRLEIFGIRPNRDKSEIRISTPEAHPPSAEKYETIPKSEYSDCMNPRRAASWCRTNSK